MSRSLSYVVFMQTINKRQEKEKPIRQWQVCMVWYLFTENPAPPSHHRDCGLGVAIFKSSPMSIPL